MATKKVEMAVKMDEEAAPEEVGKVTIEVNQPRFRDKARTFWEKHKKKFIIGGLAAIGIGAGAFAADKLIFNKADHEEVPAYTPDPEALSWMENARALEAHTPEKAETEAVNSEE